MTRAARFSQADLRRAIEAFRATGLPVSGIQIGPDGTITVLTNLGFPANDANPLDRVLSR